MPDQVTTPISDFETKDVFAVWVNTDLTGGRGHEYVTVFCEIEATARRLAKKTNVRGTDGRVQKITLLRVKNATPSIARAWYGPIQVQYPSASDKEDQKVIDRRNAAIEKASLLGLSPEDIAAIRT